MTFRKSTPNFSSANRRKHRPNIWLLGVAMLLALFAGCGKGESSSKGPKHPEPLQACDLLTQAEAETLIGGPVDEPQKRHQEHEDPKSWMSMCNYYSAEKSLSAGLTIMPHGRKVNGAEAFALYEAELQEGLRDDYKMEIVNGVGEYAGWEKKMKQLTIFQGPFMLIVSAGGPELQDTATLDLAKQLSQNVLAKLPQ